MKTVSVIIPAYNEGKYIGKCLKALYEQSYDGESFEVIVVDNCSTDNTVDVAKNYSVKIFKSDASKVSLLRNFGAKNAKGHFLAFVDADNVVPKDWLQEALKYFEDQKTAAVGAFYSLPSDASWVATTWEVILQARELGEFPVHEVDWLPSGNLIVRKDVFDELNGFDETLSGSADVDLGLRIREMGYKILSDWRLSSLHIKYPETLTEFFNKEIWHQRSLLKFAKKYNFRPKTSLPFLIFVSYYFLWLVLLPIVLPSFFYFKISNYIIGYLALPFLPAGFLALQVSITKKKSIIFYLQALVLYVVWGVASAMSLLKYNLWSQ